LHKLVGTVRETIDTVFATRYCNSSVRPDYIIHILVSILRTLHIGLSSEPVPLVPPRLKKHSPRRWASLSAALYAVYMKDERLRSGSSGDLVGGGNSVISRNSRIRFWPVSAAMGWKTSPPSDSQ
jgi:hypothetical protein